MESDSTTTPMEEEQVDEFGRPLRPNVDSSDSDSDKDYDRYRKRRDSRDRDTRDSRDTYSGGVSNKYSPERSRGRDRRDLSPSNITGTNISNINNINNLSGGNGGVGGGINSNIDRRRRSPSPPHYRRPRRDDWNNNISGGGDQYNNRLGGMNSGGIRNGMTNSSRGPIPIGLSPNSGGGHHHNPHHHHHHNPHHLINNSNSNNSNIDSLDQQKIKRITKRGDLFFDPVLKSFKQFLDYLDDTIPQPEAEKKYDEYKAEYYKRQSKIFFKEHQNEEWFKEKYEPSFLLKKRNEKLEKTPNLIQSFKLLLNDQNHKFSLETKDNVVAGDRLDLDHVHHHDNNNISSSGGSSSQLSQQATVDNIENGGNNDMNVDEVNTTTTTNISSSNTSNTSSKPKENTTLFIKTISPTCTKDELLEVLNKVGSPEQQPCVTKLNLSEPVRYKNFNRLGWVTYKNVELSSKALKELNGYKMRDFDLYLNINKISDHDAEKRFKTTPSIASTETRLNIDLQQATTLVNLFDQDKNITTENPLFTSEHWESYSTVEKLDRIIQYLRYVHFFCYYCCDEFNDESEIDRKCGTIHLRKSLDSQQHQQQDKEKDELNNINNSSSNNDNNSSSIDNNGNIENAKEVEVTNGKEGNDNVEMGDINNETNNNNEINNNTTTSTTTTETNVNSSNTKDEIIEKPRISIEAENNWVTNLDNNIKNKINKINNDEQYTCNEMITKAGEEYILNNTLKIEEEKYRCGICVKLFKGAEYVKKHIHLKHPEELKKQSEDEGIEEQFFTNYLTDPKRITPMTPIGGPQGGVGGMIGGVGGQPVNGSGSLLGSGPGVPGYGFPPQVLPPGARGARWNNAIGQWETPIGMVPSMILTASGQIISTNGSGGMGLPKGSIGSPIFTSPNSTLRGRNGPPILGTGSSGGGRRGFPSGVNGMSNRPLGTMPPNDPRYRPYPNTQRPTQSSLSLDPRGIREYVDLDAPMDTVPDIDYRSALKEYQNKKSS